MLAEHYFCPRCKVIITLKLNVPQVEGEFGIIFCDICVYPIVFDCGRQLLYILDQKTVDNPANSIAIQNLKDEQERRYHELGQWG